MVTRESIVRAASGWLGTPYQHQASLKGVGCDCLGLLRGVWREVIGDEPERPTPYSPAWAELDAADPLLEAAGRHLVPVSEARPGSVLIFRWRAGVSAKHCGIVSAPGRMIHAHDGACTAEVVIVPAWARRITGIFDFPHMIDTPGVSD
jgi:NlpC/P60 family putative phage cell wall peptidase